MEVAQSESNYATGSKYELDERVWVLEKNMYTNRLAHIMCGKVTGIIAEANGDVKYKLSCSEHQGHSYRANKVFATREEAISEAKRLISLSDQLATLWR